jgi:dTDP-4-amino-4,6-dideoxygalactose transaminase
MIPLFKTRLPDKEKLMPELEKTLYSGTLTEGKKVREFEEALQDYIGCNLRPLSTNSCTSALQLAYRCANVKDKIVLATPMTCVATNMSILAEGGKIVWCDINPDSGNICVKSIRKNLERYGKSVAAISFVDFAGNPANITNLARLRQKYEVMLIEDAAQSLGAGWCGVKVGNIEYIDFTCFSFQAIKHLTTADGGALVCQYEEDWERAKRLKWFGVDRDKKVESRWDQEIPECGYKFHMNDVNATIGLAQLEGHIPRTSLVNFSDYLKKIDGFKVVKPEEGYSASWILVARVKRRKDFMKMMRDAGIEVGVPFIENTRYDCFKNSNSIWNPNEELPGLKKFAEEYVAMPCGWWLSNKEIQYIINTIKKGW